MESDLKNTGQSHYFDENMKWSHGHYGHFAPAGLTEPPIKVQFLTKVFFPKVWDSVWGLYSITWYNSCGNFDENSIQTRLDKNVPGNQQNSKNHEFKFWRSAAEAPACKFTIYAEEIHLISAE